jgi:F0F1-type ATP synthase assembly protein I
MESQCGNRWTWEASVAGASETGRRRKKSFGDGLVDGMDRLRLRGSTAWALVGAQALTAAIAAIVVWIGWGHAAALAALFGGFVVILPTVYFAAKVHLRAGQATAAEVLGAFYRAEVGKLILTAFLFWIGALLFGRYFAPLIITSLACLAMNWVMVAVTRNW